MIVGPQTCGGVVMLLVLRPIMIMRRRRRRGATLGLEVLIILDRRGAQLHRKRTAKGGLARTSAQERARLPLSPTEGPV